MNTTVSFEEMVPMLNEHDFGVLATNGSEYPFTSLVTICVSDDNRHLLFPTLRETRKYANLIRDAHVSVMLDNRSVSAKEVDGLYALSVFGTAGEVADPLIPACRERFLRRHPHLAGFLSLPQTALIQVAFTKLILAEEFGKIREFDCPL